MTYASDTDWTVYIWFKKYTFPNQKEAYAFYHTNKSWFKAVLGPKTK